VKVQIAILSKPHLKSIFTNNNRVFFEAKQNKLPLYTMQELLDYENRNLPSGSKKSEIPYIIDHSIKFLLSNGIHSEGKFLSLLSFDIIIFIISSDIFCIVR
jgi:UDP-N-acetylglucosamine pyrophosphorylase